jgi:hypothetical protein
MSRDSCTSGCLHAAWHVQVTHSFVMLLSSSVISRNSCQPGCLWTLYQVCVTNNAHARPIDCVGVIAILRCANESEPAGSAVLYTVFICLVCITSRKLLKRALRSPHYIHAKCCCGAFHGDIHKCRTNPSAGNDTSTALKQRHQLFQQAQPP